MRRFGIELELVTPRSAGSPEAAATRILTQAGIANRSNSHFGRAYDVWQAKPDGSLSPPGRCIEVVSRILPATPESYEEIRRVVTALEMAGFGVNRTCGFHVHVSVADLPVRTRLLIALRYAKMRDEINRMLPVSRRTGNGWCPTANSSQQALLEQDIINNVSSSSIIQQMSHYSATNMQWSQSGENARIEFRQAAGTCNAEKVIGWVKFLQEMIDEVARRAEGVTFGQRRTVPTNPTPPVAPVAPVRVPRIRTGSHGDWVLNRLTNFGSVTQGEAGAQGILPHVFRSLISGFRRHGAQISTISSGGQLAYRVANVGMARADIFLAPAQPAPAPVQERVVEMPGTTPASFVQYDFFSGLTEATAAWVRARRAVFAEDTTESQAVQA